jgi:hypothetical protein
MMAAAGALHASAAVVASVAAAGDVAEARAATVDVASGVPLGAFAIVVAHPAISTERKVAAKSRIADIMAMRGGARGKSSLKTQDQRLEPT